MNIVLKYFILLKNLFYLKPDPGYEPNTLSFRTYLIGVGFNRSLIMLAVLLLTIQLVIFKFFYPYAGFINGDSYQYISSAFYNLRADIYPIGYPKFLRLFSVFTFGDTSLVVFQYFFVVVGLLFLIFSLCYFYKFKRLLKIGLVAVCVINPVFLYLANYVSSDSLFLGLSFFWIAHLVWIVNRPTAGILFSHGLIIFFAFTVRYNALFYPLIALLTLVVSKEKLKLKLCGILFSLILIAGFINFTANQWERISGTKQFSPFTGWQLANNAMYAYKFVDSVDRKTLPVQFREIDQDVRNFFDSTKDHTRFPSEMIKASTVYMWDSASPLHIYMHRHAVTSRDKRENVMWSKVAPLYTEYGKVLIKTYPKSYLENYLWANFIKYYAPPVEFLEYYSTNVDSVPIVAKQWFWYPSNKLKFRVVDMKVNTLTYYPVAAGISNALFLALSVAFLIIGGFKNSGRLFKFWIIMFSFWIVNLAFSVFASPVALRFQLFPFILSLLFDLILIEAIWNLGIEKEGKGQSGSSFIEADSTHLETVL